MQQEQERLKDELALRVAEVQEENRKKLAAATLIELELQEDLLEINGGFNDTLSQLSKDSDEQQSARVNDWVNNSPTLISATNQRINVPLKHPLLNRIRNRPLERNHCP